MRLFTKLSKNNPALKQRTSESFCQPTIRSARAVGLANTVKGSRLLIESSVVHDLLIGHPHWRTVEGYIRNVDLQTPISSILRRICSSPSGESYELLYFWKNDAEQSDDTSVAEHIREVAEFKDPKIAEHLMETLKLFKRSEKRRKSTERALIVSQMK